RLDGQTACRFGILCILLHGCCDFVHSGRGLLQACSLAFGPPGQIQAAARDVFGGRPDRPGGRRDLLGDVAQTVLADSRTARMTSALPHRRPPEICWETRVATWRVDVWNSVMAAD